MPGAGPQERRLSETAKSEKARKSAIEVGALIAEAGNSAADDQTTKNPAVASYPRLTAADLLELDLPNPHRLGGPFTEAQLILLYANRGVGKTFFSMNLSLAIAIGKISLCGWSFGEGRKVLYVDGEMSLGMMQQRFRDLLAGSGAMKSDGPEVQFELLSSTRLWDTEGHGIKDLFEEENRLRLENAIEESGARVVVLDNLSTLSTGDENSAEDWAPFGSWLVKLRAKGLSVILVHHAGKGGKQRGTSSREGPMDLIIKLRHVSGYKAEDGCRAEVIFEKCRDAYGAGVEPRKIQLVDRNGGRWFSYLPSREARLARMIEMHEEGLPLRDIGKALDPPLSHTAVRNELNKAGIDCSR